MSNINYPNTKLIRIGTGRWIDTMPDAKREWPWRYQCSYCGKLVYTTGRYCMNCGAEMEQEW